MTIPNFGAPPDGARTFAPVEDTLIAYLTQAGMPSVSVVGPDLTYPHVKVRRMPAGGEKTVSARALVQVDTFHTDRDLADVYARRVNELIGNPWTGLSGAAVSWTAIDGTPITVYVDAVEVDQQPAWLTWDDEDHVKRQVAVYIVTSRRDARPLI